MLVGSDNDGSSFPRGRTLESCVQRFLVPALVGLGPAVLAALTWSPDGQWSALEGLQRGLSFPVVISELCTIAIAFREGLLSEIRRWNWSRAVVVALVILATIAATTAAFAPTRATAIQLTLYWAIHGLFAVSMAYLAKRLFTARDLTRACVAGFALFSIEIVIYVLAIPDWNSFNWRSGFLGFGHIRHAGYYLAAMSALAFGAMSVAGRRWEQVWNWLWGACAFGLILWTGSRGAAVAVVGAAAIGFVVVPALRSSKYVVGSISGIVFAVLMVMVLPSAPSPLMGLTRTVKATAAEDVSTGRTTIWSNVARAIQERPLFGYGEGQMAKVAPYNTMVQPHDSLLQVTLAWGFVGLACVLILAGAYAWRSLPALRKAENLAPPFLAMSAIGILSLYDGSLYYALPQSLFFAFAGAIAANWGRCAPEGPSVPLNAPSSNVRSSNSQRPR